jgi:signal transduction histidine kinase
MRPEDPQLPGDHARELRKGKGGLEGKGGRAEAVLAVLRGVSLAEVAAQAGASADEVLGWVDTFCEAGEARLAEAPVLEPTGRDRFLTLIAHEFRTPLSIIGGWADLYRPNSRTPGHRPS